MLGYLPWLQVAGGNCVCTPSGADGKSKPGDVIYGAVIGPLTNVQDRRGLSHCRYGTWTESFPKVLPKIFGPGNQYVTCAKQLINKEGIAIDMPAGPSEVAVYADQTANPFVAADLFKPGRTWADSQVVLVASTMIG